MARELQIADTLVRDDGPAYVIAEIGSNARADTELSRQFIRAAADAGASAVKFQKRNNRTLYTRAALNAPYVHEHSYGATYGEHRAALEYTVAQLAEIQAYARFRNLAFGCTCFDVESANDLAALDVDFVKIASACITDTELLKHVAQLGIPVIISTGTGDEVDVTRAASIMHSAGAEYALLQCSAVYPLTDPSLLNLNVITSFRRNFPSVVTGLSSHYATSRDAEIAYALGGRIFEKHFTLDRQAKGADHQFSMTPAAFALMVEHLERVRKMLGSGTKRRLPEEALAVQKMGHSLYAARDLPEGHRLTPADIAIKSPGGGLPPSLLHDYIGRRLREPLAEDDLIPQMAWYQG